MHPCGPLELIRMTVDPAWIDYNGHMNVGYYVVAFDRATDAFIDILGLDEAYRERTGCSVYVLETHVTYQSELKPTDQMDVDLQLIGVDAKRLHYFMRMHRVADGALAATSEIMLLHVDTRASRACSMPASARERAEDIAREHAALPAPPELGQRIALRRREARTPESP